MRQRTASITTRIKTHSLQHDKFALLVREQHPLQQGLRRRLVAKSVNFAAVREQHPLQQGLRRLELLYCQSVIENSQRTASITTRIKTQYSLLLSVESLQKSENSIHYNKD